MIQIEYTQVNGHKLIDLDLCQTALFALSNEGTDFELVTNPKEGVGCYFGSFNKSVEALTKVVNMEAPLGRHGSLIQTDSGFIDTYAGIAERKDIYGREISVSTLADALVEPSKGAYFIKPLRIKQFPGRLVKSYGSYMQLCKSVEEITSKQWCRVFVSTPIEFISEWRVFIHNQQIIGVNHYTGDFSLPLGTNNNIESLLKESLEASEMLQHVKAFSMDVGLTSAGELYVVEFNDFFALGSYGCEPNAYTRAARDRWGQLVNDEYITCFGWGWL